VKIAHDKGIVEAQTFTEKLDVFGICRHIRCDHIVDGIDSRRLQACKYDKADQQQHRNHHQKLFTDEFQQAHSTPFLATPARSPRRNGRRPDIFLLKKGSAS